MIGLYCTELAVSRDNIVVVSCLFRLQVPLAVLTGRLLLDETDLGNRLIGIGLLLGGIIIVTISGRRAPAK